MTDTIPQKNTAFEKQDSNEVGQEDIVIRTMKGDLEKLSGAPAEKEKKPEVPVTLAEPISKEAQAPIVHEPPLIPMAPPEAKTSLKPPILVIPPKTIPPKEIAEIPVNPLFKAMPVWIKISGIGLGVILSAFLGLYGYWKIFIQNQPIIIPTPTATTTPPTLPIIPMATTTAPIKFFKKLPNSEVTIDMPSKTSDALINALKSEAAIEEARASVKQIKITYQGKPITAEEFFNLMLIFAPQNFLANYENEFAFAFFNQKEGVRPVLVLKIKNKILAENQMKDWETGKMPSDILPLFLNDFKLPKYLPKFKSYLFIGQPVRYMNINMPFASLNYSIYNDFLIFTASSAGMFVILQDLTGKSVSIDYLKSLEASIGDFIR